MSNQDDASRFSRGSLGGGGAQRPFGDAAQARTARHDGLTGPPRGTLVADSGARPAKRGGVKPKAAPAVKTREITIIGTFRNPFGGLADETKAMHEDRWEPTTADFKAVAGNSLTTHSYLGMLGIILADGDKETKDGSISRINIFSHANKDLIAFDGTVTPRSMSADVQLRVDSALSADTLDVINKEGVTFTLPSGSKLGSKTFTMDDVRRRFAKDAIIVIYACHSGLDGPFIQYLADTFQVKIRGFKDVIGYFPTYSGDDPPKVNRRRVGLGHNSKQIETDFHNLDKATTGVIEKIPKP